MKVIEGGRSLEQMIEDVRSNGLIYTIPGFRDFFIQRLGASVKAGAENIVAISCVSFTSLNDTRTVFRLLDRLHIDYALLEDQRCCGAPMIASQVIKGEDRTKADLAAKEFAGINIDLARKAGARRVVHACLWCASLAHYFYPDCDVEQVYYLDILDGPLQSEPLRLIQPAAVAYFPGCHLRKAVYAPHLDWDPKWPEYRAWLDRIEGLTVLDIPKYCCATTADAIFRQAEKHNISTLVTPCRACFHQLRAKAPQGMQVKWINHLLLEALQCPAEI